MTGDHLDARLDAMSARQERFDTRLDEIERMTQTTAYKLDTALADVSAMRNDMAAMASSVGEIRRIIEDAHLLARFTRRTITVLAVVASALYGVTSWADVKAAINTWLAR